MDHPHPSSVLKCNLKKKRIIPECNICTFRHTVAKAFVLHFIRKLCCNRKRTTILSDCALSARTQRGMVHVSFTHLYEKEEEEEGEGGRGRSCCIGSFIYTLTVGLGGPPHSCGWPTPGTSSLHHVQFVTDTQSLSSVHVTVGH